eukprot:2912721-Ditylum_brightwellii.AAC.1
MERREKNEYLVCDKDNDGDNGEDDSDNNGNDDGVDDGAEGADKHCVYLSQAADCCRTERREQNEHLVYDKNNDGDDDSVNDSDVKTVNDGADGIDDDVDNGAEGAD